MEDARVKVRERGQEAGVVDQYDRAIIARKKFVDQQMMGKLVIKSSDRDWELNMQARQKHMLQPMLFDDHALREWRVFLHDIGSFSGKHTHQGGLVIFVLEGKGYTVVDGIRYDWEEGDLILLPVKPGGVEHQHFNLNPGQGCMWIAFIYRPYWDALASQMVQNETNPDYKE